MTQRVVNYTYGTGNPVLPDGSVDVRDGIDNLQSFDVFMNAPEDTYNQRDGKIVRTVAGMNSELDAQILNMGFTRIGTFASGATLTNPRQTLLWDIADGGDGQEYGWSGAFPKVVPAASTPSSTGGISVGSWISRFDPELRIQAREALRRSYAEAGYNLVSGSFEAGGTLVNANDVLLQESTGKAFSGPAGVVAAGTNPASGGFVDRSGDISVMFRNVSEMLSSSALLVVGGRYRTGGTLWQMNKKSSPVVIGDFSPIGAVVINDFGSIGSGIGDDSSVFQLAFNSAIDNTYVLGDRYYYRPYEFALGKSANGYALSGNISLPENAKIDLKDNTIIPIGGNKCTFRLNLRDYKNSDSTTPGYYYRAHVQGFEFRNAYVGSPTRGFGVPTAAVDVEHFILIDGGWIIRSGFYDIRPQPGLAIKSMVHFDLTHRNPNSFEVGVPDQIRMERVSCQYAENASYTASFEGDDTTIGTGSRCGAVIFDAVYGGATNGFDWNRVRNGSTDFGVIRNKNCLLAEHTLDFVFGGEHLIVVPDSADPELSRMKGMKLPYINVEKNADRGTGRGPMLYGGIYSQCDFGHIVPYSEMNRLNRPAQLLDITAKNCTFDKIILNDLGHGGDLLPVDYVNLRAGSYGNVFKMLPESRTVNTKNISYYMAMFKVPKADTEFLWLNGQGRKATTRQKGLSVGADITVLNLSSRTFDVSSVISAQLGIEHFSGSTSTWEIYAQYGASSEKILTTVSATSGDDLAIELMMNPLYRTPLWNDFSNEWGVIVKTTKNSGGSTTLTTSIGSVPIDGSLGFKLKARCTAAAGADVNWLGSIAYHSYTDVYINDQS